jgi:hypothetical protein
LRFERRFAFLLAISTVSGACFEAPEYKDLLCDTSNVCPDDYVCGPDGRCHEPCDRDEDCSQLAQTCREGMCSALVIEPCLTAGDCTTPANCQTLEGVECIDGNCKYGRQICETPPPPQCVANDTIFRTYGSAGMCFAETGSCEYPPTDTECPGCTERCLAPCLAMTCPPENGGCSAGRCVPVPLEQGGGAGCEYNPIPDGMPCTLESGEGICLGGNCVECDENADCNDGEVCTSDSCDVATGACVYTALQTSCDDGDPCTQNDICKEGACFGDDPITCNESPGQCLEPVGACVPGVGACNYPPKATTATCDDGQLCTRDDHCDGAGGCTGTSYSCNDNNACTADACDGIGGCDRTRVAPDNLQPTAGRNVNTQEVVMTWTACSDARHYDIAIEFWNGSAWQFYFTYDENNPTAPTAAMKSLFPCGAACNSDMRFRVRAFDGSTHGPWSDWSVYHWNNCRTC